MLLLTTDSYNGLIRQAIELYPSECCGFLLGKENNGQPLVTKILVCENRSERKNKEFRLPAQDYMNAEKTAEEKGLHMLGIYHSHPEHDAVPSEKDAANALPNFSYVIISVFKHKAPSARSWRLTEGGFEEEKMITDQNTIAKNNTAYGNHYHSHTTS